MVAVEPRGRRARRAPGTDRRLGELHPAGAKVLADRVPAGVVADLRDQQGGHAEPGQAHGDVHGGAPEHLLRLTGGRHHDVDEGLADHHETAAGHGAQPWKSMAE